MNWEKILRACGYKRRKDPPMFPLPKRTANTAKIKHEWHCAGIRPDGSSLLKVTKESIQTDRGGVRMRHGSTHSDFSSINAYNLVETKTECTGCKAKPVVTVEGF